MVAAGGGGQGSVVAGPTRTSSYSGRHLRPSVILSAPRGGGPLPQGAPTALGGPAPRGPQWGPAALP